MAINNYEQVWIDGYDWDGGYCKVSSQANLNTNSGQEVITSFTIDNTRRNFRTYFMYKIGNSPANFTWAEPGQFIGPVSCNIRLDTGAFTVAAG